MSTTKLAKWGNSQGIIIPKHLCEHIGLKVGDAVHIDVNKNTGTIELTCSDRAARDRRAISG